MDPKILKNIEKYEKKLLGLKACNNKKIDYDQFFNLAQQYEQQAIKAHEEGYTIDNEFFIKAVFYYYAASFHKAEAKDKLQDLNTKFSASSYESFYEDYADIDVVCLPYTTYIQANNENFDKCEAFKEIYTDILQSFANDNDIYIDKANIELYPPFLFHIIYTLLKNCGDDNFDFFFEVDNTTLYHVKNISYQNDLFILPKSLYTFIVQVILTKHKCADILSGMNAQSAYHIGIAHLNGELVPKDINLAFIFLSYSAVCGNSLAYMALGLSFSSHEGFFTKENVNQLEFFLYAYRLLISSHNLIEISTCYSFHYQYNLENLSHETNFVLYHFELFEEIAYNAIVCMLAIFEHGINFKADINKDLFDLYHDTIDDLIKTAVTHNQFFESTKLTTAIAALIACKYNKAVDFAGNAITLLKQNNKKFKNKSNIKIMFELLKKGLAERNKLAVYVYLNFVIENNLITKDDEVYIQCARTYKLGKILYSYAVYNFSGKQDLPKDMDKYAEYMDSAAMYCYPPAQFDISLNTDNHNKALYFGFKALQNNYVLANYSLAKLLMPQTKELAYTFLFIAAQYNYLPAIEALSKAKANGDYEPFEYIKYIEKIDALSQSDATACIMMFLIYDRSNIVPHNSIKANFYLQKAIDLGSHTALDILREKDRQKDNYAYNVHTHLPSFNEGLITLTDFFKIDSENSIKFPENLAKLLSGLFESLLRNQNVLCFRSLYDSYKSFFWHSMIIPNTIEQLARHLEEHSDIWTNFDECIEQICSFSSSLKIDWEINYKECESKLSAINKTEQDNSMINMLKGMLCLRSICCKNNKDQAVNYFTLAWNAGASEAFAMSFYSYTCLDDDKTLQECELQKELGIKDLSSILKVGVEQ